MKPAPIASPQRELSIGTGFIEIGAILRKLWAKRSWNHNFDPIFSDIIAYRWHIWDVFWGIKIFYVKSTDRWIGVQLQHVFMYVQNVEIFLYLQIFGSTKSICTPKKNLVSNLLSYIREFLWVCWFWSWCPPQVSLSICGIDGMEMGTTVAFFSSQVVWKKSDRAPNVLNPIHIKCFAHMFCLYRSQYWSDFAYFGTDRKPPICGDLDRCRSHQWEHHRRKGKESSSVKSSCQKNKYKKCSKEQTQMETETLLQKRRYADLGKLIRKTQIKRSEKKLLSRTHLPWTAVWIALITSSKPNITLVLKKNKTKK